MLGPGEVKNKASTRLWVSWGQGCVSHWTLASLNRRSHRWINLFVGQFENRHHSKAVEKNWLGIWYVISVHQLVKVTGNSGTLGTAEEQIYPCTPNQVSFRQVSHSSQWFALFSRVTYRIWSHVSMGVVPPPNTQTVKNTRSSVVVNTICLGWDSVLRIARAKAMAPRKPSRETERRKWISRLTHSLFTIFIFTSC